MYEIGDINNVNTEIENQPLHVGENNILFSNIPIFIEGEPVNIGFLNVEFAPNGDMSAPDVDGMEGAVTFSLVSGNVSDNTINCVFQMIDNATNGTQADVTFSYIGTKQNPQFPAPQNFQMINNYIMLGDWGFCDGVAVNGPSYCTYFAWNAPDLSETESQLVGYKIYNSEIPFMGGQVIAQPISSGLYMGEWIEGYTWITAVYSDPNGESEPSNLQSNLEGKPIFIDKNEIKSHSIIYNNQMKTIEIIGIENITSINILGVDGKFITTSELNNIDVKYLTNGLYIIKITTETGKIISDKLIIE